MSTESVLNGISMIFNRSDYCLKSVFGYFQKFIYGRKFGIHSNDAGKDKGLSFRMCLPHLRYVRMKNEVNNSKLKEMILLIRIK